MQLQQITNIEASDDIRISTGIKEFDTFLGGGFVNGETILLAGEPGTGKSTLLLQLATIITDHGERVLYVSGEESLGQMRLRAERLKTLRDSLFCTDGIILEELFKTINKLDPKFIIVDSLQMIYSTAIKGEQGTPKQMKYCLLELIAHAKRTGRILIVIGHSTKTGLIAGLLTLQHMVDAVFFITKNGDTRYINTKKNRFGATDDPFPMLMTQQGFVQFTRAVSKGNQLQNKNILPYLRHVYGDEVKISRSNLDSKINSRLVRLVIGSAMGFVEKTYFGRILNRDYEIVFKLK